MDTRAKASLAALRTQLGPEAPVVSAADLRNPPLMVVPHARNTLPDPLRSMGTSLHAQAEAVAALHLTGLRRQFEAIRDIFGQDPPHRSREGLWVALEVLLAHLRGEQIAQRDLVVRANGLLSAPTLSRVVIALERQGLVTSELAPGHARMKVLHPTKRALDILTARAEEAFGDFAKIIVSLEDRLANVTEEPIVDGHPP